MKHILYKLYSAIMLMALGTLPLMASESSATGEASYFSLNNDSILMLLIAFLAFVIYYLAKLMLYGVQINLNKKSKTVVAIAAISLLGSSSVHASAFGGFTSTTWVLFSIVMVEVFIILVMMAQVSKLMSKFNAVGKEVSEGIAEKKIAKKSFIADLWERMNKLRPMEDESELETGHEFDGIKELDNVTPPWFTVGFIGTIIFAVVYMWVYHVSKSAPLQIEEYEIEMAIAEAKIAEYLATQVDLIDENNVTLLTDNASIANGKKIYDANCIACHRADGGGSVGSNLTDEYWLHGGSVKDVFHTIKYGVIEKGMIPWKDELSARQIAEVVAYIHTLQGTNPIDAKAPEGDKYVEEGDDSEPTEQVEA